MNFLWDNIFRRGKKETDLRSILRENFIFQDLSDRELHVLEDIVHMRKYHSGESIFRQGEVGIGMYIIARGNVEIFVSGPASASLPTLNSTTADDSRDIFITQLAAGDFFGELSLVEENGRRSASAIARDETTLIGFFKPDLMEMRARTPQTSTKIIFRLAEILGRRLKETTEKVSELRRALKDARIPPIPPPSMSPQASGSPNPAAPSAVGYEGAHGSET